eukprot:g29567.t1
MVLVVDYWKSNDLTWLDGNGCGYGHSEYCSSNRADLSNMAIISNDLETEEDCPTPGDCKCDWFHKGMALDDDGSECWCRCGGCHVSPLLRRCTCDCADRPGQQLVRQLAREETGTGPMCVSASKNAKKLHGSHLSLTLWPYRMMRMPTKMEMDSAHTIEGATKAGSVGAPPIAMTEVQDEIVIEEPFMGGSQDPRDLKREPWAKRDLKPKSDPLPPACIIDDPAYRGAEWKEVCRVKLRKLPARASVTNLRREFGIVAVAVESRDGLQCGLDVPLQTGGSVLFGFENGEEKFESSSTPATDLRTTWGWAAWRDGRPGEPEDPRDFVERVWLPVYKFEVPSGIAGEAWVTRSRSLLLGDKDPPRQNRAKTPKPVSRE